MAVEPAHNETATQDFQAHARDYSGFIRLFTYGAIISFVIAIAVVFIIA